MANAAQDRLMKLEDRPWWTEMVGLKDVLSLRELASRFGAAPAAISNALRRNGLDRQAAPPGPRANRDPEVTRAAQDALARIDVVQPNVAAPGRAVSAVAKAAVSAVVNTVAAPSRTAGKTARAVTNPSGAARGYQVQINGDHYIVIAPDIAVAARLASSAQRGPVTSVALLGDALGA